MNLPDRTLNIIRDLLRHLPQADDNHLTRTISEANELLDCFSPNPSKIFERGRYTDFETTLAQETINGQLHFKIGTLNSEIAALEDTIKQLKQENGELKSLSNKWSNLKKGERKELLKEKELAKLEAANEKLRSENKNMKTQREKLIIELIQFKNSS